MPIYTKYRGGRAYLYEQHSYREGKKVRTRSRYLGPVESYKIEPGETAAWNGIVQAFEAGPQEKPQQWSQEKFLADTQGPSEASTSDGDVNESDK